MRKLAPVFVLTSIVAFASSSALAMGDLKHKKADSNTTATTSQQARSGTSGSSYGSTTGSSGSLGATGSSSLNGAAATTNGSSGTLSANGSASGSLSANGGATDTTGSATDTSTAGKSSTSKSTGLDNAQQHMSSSGASHENATNTPAATHSGQKSKSSRCASLKPSDPQYAANDCGGSTSASTSSSR